MNNSEDHETRKTPHEDLPSQAEEGLEDSHPMADIPNASPEADPSSDETAREIPADGLIDSQADQDPSSADRQENQAQRNRPYSPQKENQIPPTPDEEPTGEDDEPSERFRRLMDDIEEEEIHASEDQIESAPDSAIDLEPEWLDPSLWDTIPPRADPSQETIPSPLKTSDTPLPERVPETDIDTTRITPAAYAPTQPSIPTTPEPPKRRWERFMQGFGGCSLRIFIIGIFATIALLIGSASFGIYEYYALAATLPPVEDLQSKASQFETTRILDREGNLLYEIIDPQAGRRTYVPLSRISPFMTAATVATEDSLFYSHVGFDLFGIVRAFIQNYQAGEVVSGASTITQQIARNLLFTPEERGRRTLIRKIREAMLATEITRRYTKDEILELYLNQNYYGNLAYGVEAAALTYFNTTADKLTLAQSAFLAGLVQAPSVYDVFTNREVTLA
ncbi:MAG: transglycosylase domain-containing protein, partial [Anaerolineales bacterium]